MRHISFDAVCPFFRRSEAGRQRWRRRMFSCDDLTELKMSKLRSRGAAKEFSPGREAGERDDMMKFEPRRGERRTGPVWRFLALRGSKELFGCLANPGLTGLLLNAGLMGITTTRPHNEYAEGVPEISRWQAPSARCHRNRTATTVDPGRGRGRSLHTRAERVGQSALTTGATFFRRSAAESS